MADTSSDERTRVYARFRPMLRQEADARGFTCVDVKSANDVEVTRPGTTQSARKFTFDRIFGEKTHQEEIFREIGVPCIQNMVEGYRAGSCSCILRSCFHRDLRMHARYTRSFSSWNRTEPTARSSAMARHLQARPSPCWVRREGARRF